MPRAVKTSQADACLDAELDTVRRIVALARTLRDTHGTGAMVRALRHVMDALASGLPAKHGIKVPDEGAA